VTFRGISKRTATGMAELDVRAIKARSGSLRSDADEWTEKPSRRNMCAPVVGGVPFRCSKGEAMPRSGACGSITSCGCPVTVSDCMGIRQRRSDRREQPSGVPVRMARRLELCELVCAGCPTAGGHLTWPRVGRYVHGIVRAWTALSGVLLHGSRILCGVTATVAGIGTFVAKLSHGSR